MLRSIGGAILGYFAMAVLVFIGLLGGRAIGARAGENVAAVESRP